MPKVSVIFTALLILLFTACPRTDFTSAKKPVLSAGSFGEPNSLSGEKTEKKEDAIKNLICFKCHIYNRFVETPKKGVFSHIVHTQFEYHCNQCHSFRGHKTMVVNNDICINCHGEMPKLKRVPG